MFVDILIHFYVDIIPYDGIDSQTDMVDLNRIITDQVWLFPSRYICYFITIVSFMQTLHKLLVADLPPNSQLVVSTTQLILQRLYSMNSTGTL